MNEILLYDIIGIDDSSAAAVRQKIKQADAKKPLTVRINSDGGFAFDGFAIFNALQEFAGKVVVYVDGIAASAASLPLMAADEVVMGPLSFVMIHEAWNTTSGNKRDLMKTASLLENIDTQAAQQYAQKMQITPDEAMRLLEAETWFNATDAVNAKLATSIAGQQKAAAFVEIDPRNEAGNRWGYRNVPKSLLVDSEIAMRNRVLQKLQCHNHKDIMARIQSVR